MPPRCPTGSFPQEVCQFAAVPLVQALTEAVQLRLEGQKETAFCAALVVSDGRQPTVGKLKIGTATRSYCWLLCLNRSNVWIFFVVRFMYLNQAGSGVESNFGQFCPFQEQAQEREVVSARVSGCHEWGCL